METEYSNHKRSILLAYNPLSGTVGVSERVAEALTSFRHPRLRFEKKDIRGLEKSLATQKNVDLSPYDDVFVLGGDGSLFKFLSALQYYEGKAPDIAHISMGGENIGAQATIGNKNILSTHVRHILHVGNQIDKSKLAKKMLVPGTYSFDKENPNPFWWCVGPTDGISVAALEKINDLRYATGNGIRRKISALVYARNEFPKRRTEVEVFYNGKQKKAAEALAFRSPFNRWSKVPIGNDNRKDHILFIAPDKTQLSSHAISNGVAIDSAMYIMQHALKLPKRSLTGILQWEEIDDTSTIFYDYSSSSKRMIDSETDGPYYWRELTVTTRTEVSDTAKKVSLYVTPE